MSPEAPRHVPALDGLRGVAILLVLAGHLTPAAEKIPEGLGFLEVARVTAGAGWIGVDLFFVLSGFLITGILEDARGSARYFRHFWTRRALRIFPAYYLFLAATFVWHRGEGAHAPYWLYLQNYAMDATPDGLLFHWKHTWSLAVEEQFYLVWPVVVWLAGRETLIRICIALAVIAPALRTALVAAGVDSFAIYVATPARMDALALGALVALLARGERGLAPYVPMARSLAASAAVGVASIAVFQGHLGPRSPAVQTAGYSLLAVGFASGVLVVAAGGAGRWLRALELAPLRSFGRVSYAIYLVHPIALGALWRLFDGLELQRMAAPAAMALHLAYCASAVGASYTCALASWHLYEKHFLRMKKRFPMSVEAEVPDEMPRLTPARARGTSLT